MTNPGLTRIGTSVVVAVGRLLGDRLATTLVDCYFHHFFLFVFCSPSRPFLIEQLFEWKSVFSESCLERAKTLVSTLSRPPWLFFRFRTYQDFLRNFFLTPLCHTPTPWHQRFSPLVAKTPTKPQNNLNLTQLSWVWHDYDFAHHHQPTTTTTKVGIKIMEFAQRGELGGRDYRRIGRLP